MVILALIWDHPQNNRRLWAFCSGHCDFDFYSYSDFGFYFDSYFFYAAPAVPAHERRASPSADEPGGVCEDRAEAG